MKKISVIGSGSWGIALAVMLDKYGHDVTIWSWKEEEAEDIRRNREHKEFLPGIEIRESIKIITDAKEAIEGAEIVITAIPSKFVRINMEKFASFFNSEQIIVNVAKGLEDDTLLRLSQVIEQCIPICPVCTLVGPSHAEEVSREIPTTCAISCKNMEVAKMIQDEFSNPVFRLYTNEDMIGMEIGAALKNVIALAAGMSDGLGFGDNSKAALMTRGIVEISRLGVAMGANSNTFAGLSGIGDLIVTCTSMHSRNRRAGIMLGEGKSLEDTLQSIHMVVEGVNTAKAANDLAKEYNVEMPITKQINEVLFDGKDPRKAVMELMMRGSKSEHL